MIDGGLRPIFRDKLRTGFHWQSVETGGIGLGIPDSNYCGSELREQNGVVLTVGVEGWIEFKQTDGWACTLRPEQVGWLLKRSMVGGRVFVVTRRWHDGGVRRGDACDELWVHWGGHARELRDGGLQAAAPYLALSGGPRLWDWQQVRQTLLTGGLAAPG